MKTHRLASFTFLVLLALAAAACSSRSISNSGYPDAYGRGTDNPRYRGELSEFDVLGIEDSDVSEAEIAAALKNAAPVALSPGSRVMVLQSGADLPDEAMLATLREHYRVGVFSGLPPQAEVPASMTSPAVEKPREHYAKSLRLAAARGGYAFVLCYWGVLEASQRSLVTKGVSWVPVAGIFVPDESQAMRIRLKLAVVDVKSGGWTMFAPTPVTDEAISAVLNRRSSDQGQVEKLKAAGYRAAVDELVRRFE